MNNNNLHKPNNILDYNHYKDVFNYHNPLNSSRTLNLFILSDHLTVNGGI